MRILIVDDQKLAREGIRVLLKRDPDMQVVGQARNGREAIDLTRQLAPDVVLMDIGLPDMDGVKATQELLTDQPNTHVLILTQYVDDALVGIAVRKGAKGFVFKSEMASDLLPALRALFNGGDYYSPTVSKLLADWNKSLPGSDPLKPD